jgi:hypothetical protein
MAALLAATLKETATITENTKRRQVTKREAVIAQLAKNQPQPICAPPRC